jgi:hypothetical protein
MRPTAAASLAVGIATAVPNRLKGTVDARVVRRDPTGKRLVPLIRGRAPWDHAFATWLRTQIFENISGNVFRLELCVEGILTLLPGHISEEPVLQLHAVSQLAAGRSSRRDRAQGRGSTGLSRAWCGLPYRSRRRCADYGLGLDSHARAASSYRGCSAREGHSTHEADCQLGGLQPISRRRRPEQMRRWFVSGCAPRGRLVVASGGDERCAPRGTPHGRQNGRAVGRVLLAARRYTRT